MHDITCPHCHKAFKVDEAGYAEILKQVRNSEFEEELHERLEAAEREKQHAVELTKATLSAQAQQAATEKDSEIAKLKTELEATEAARKFAVAEALSTVEKERDSLANALEQAQQRMEAASQLAEARLLNELQKAAADKDAELQTVRSALATLEISQQLAITQAVGAVERERDELKIGYEMQIKVRDDEITRMRDMKARLSTKMVGETLEQHCEIEFNKLRPTAFPRAYFEKDNDASSGSKGDYIYRDADESGTEIVSIMFEMKNESDSTASKSKNEDFLKELDKDRREKGCEYAVLVSLLEPDNELYNVGIVDVSYRYPKMYVVRPQFFIPIITLLRNAALNSLQYKNELAQVRTQNIDITNFESNLETFKAGFAKNYDLASRHFQEAIDEIDKSIKHMEKTKDALQATVRSFRIANDKAQDVTIKKLTKGNPTMAEKFAELRDAGADADQ